MAHLVADAIAPTGASLSNFQGTKLGWADSARPGMRITHVPTEPLTVPDAVWVIARDIVSRAVEGEDLFEVAVVHPRLRRRNTDLFPER